MNSQYALKKMLEKIAKDKELRGEPHAVLDYIMSKISFKNSIVVEQVDISKELDIHKENVSKSMKILLNKGIIQKFPGIGKTYFYELNFFYGCKELIKKLQEDRKKRMKVINGGSESKISDK